MPRKAQQKLKIMRLHDILMEHTDEDHGLSLNQIQAMLKDQGITAERKSLYDDINELRDYGIDIELRRGSNPTYHVLSRSFQLPELKLLVDSVQASKFITRKKSLELISKLEKQASVHQARKLNREVAVANRTKTDNETIYYAVDCIHDAINNNRQITFQYLEWTPKKEMKPRYNGKVYLVSICKCPVVTGSCICKIINVHITVSGHAIPVIHNLVIETCAEIVKAEIVALPFTNSEILGKVTSKSPGILRLNISCHLQFSSR